MQMRKNKRLRVVIVSESDIDFQEALRRKELESSAISS